MASKRFYWIKLKQDFYQSNDAIDMLMTQADGHGAEYVVLYQMLCLKAVNKGGGLYSQIGEIIVPYDVDKITRDCKYFERYIVTQALQLYKKLGLVYEQKNGGYLAISDIESMIGSESESAERVRRHRNNIKALQCNASCNANVTQTVTTELEIEKEKDTTIVVSNARAKFCETYAVVDDDQTTNLDFDALSKAYSKSTKWLQKNERARHMWWIVKHYDLIINNRYIDFEDTNSPSAVIPTGACHYTDEELNSLVIDVNED